MASFTSPDTGRPWMPARASRSSHRSWNSGGMKIDLALRGSSANGTHLSLR